MPRCIDADALIADLDKALLLARTNEEIADLKLCKEIVRSAPTISLDEVRGVGKWIKRFDGPYGRGRTYCSTCGKHSGIGGIKQTPPYCPNCGAKMEVE